MDLTPKKEIVKLARERLKRSDGTPHSCECDGCQLAREVLRLAGYEQGQQQD